MEAKRTAKVERQTGETSIILSLDVDGQGTADLDTGIPFFDHMLSLFAKHGLFDIALKAKGDIAVDYHHTVEDVGIVLGQAFREALGSKAGMVRYGHAYVPMDDVLARSVVDLCNRAIFVYDVTVEHPMVRDFNINLVREFFQAFAQNAAATLHLKLEYGEDAHHVAEALFKASARALDVATRVDDRLQGAIPSTKGLLT
ncbi:MAG: imidazoleglycerol-phosphate dehydratase HisB [Opitutales bacterium]|tara:strand:+ start:4433 stop:5032 length:600 start_codon:yes stop_codon:yes gene_type:complete